MDKINFRFSLLKARFPDLYQEAEKKMAGGVPRKDIIADWLNELTYLRNMGASGQNQPAEKATPAPIDDIGFAKSVMDSLAD